VKAKNWIMRLVNTRFYRFAPGIIVRRANITTGQPACRNAAGLEELTLNHSRDGGRFEDISVAHPVFGPVVIRYCRLRGTYGEDDVGHSRAKTMEAYGIGSRGDHVCLVFRNECYDLLTGWSRISGAFGITFGSANVAVQILLPDAAPVKNNTYRDNIIDQLGDHQVVRVEDFAELVRANRPRWLLDYIEQEARKNTSSEGVMERLREFLAELQCMAGPRATVRAGGQDEGEMPQHAGRSGGAVERGDGAFTPPPGKVSRPTAGKRVNRNSSGIPPVIFTHDAAKLEEMAGRAAMYQREDNLVLLNPNHDRYLRDLDRVYEEAGSDSDRQALAKKLFDEEYCVHVGKYVMMAWVFRGTAEWDDAQWERAVSMESLTVHLVEPSLVAEARRRLRQRLNSRKLES
jgi:hypothetical protein